MSKPSKQLLENITSDHFEICEMLEKLTKHANDHFGIDPENCDWGDAGSLSKVRNDLQNIVDFLDI